MITSVKIEQDYSKLRPITHTLNTLDRVKARRENSPRVGDDCRNILVDIRCKAKKAKSKAKTKLKKELEYLDTIR